MPTRNDFDPHIVERIVNAVRPLLAGFPQEVQGAALCELTAQWLAGNLGPDRDAYRRELYELHFKMLWELVEVNEKWLMERMPTEGSG